MTPSVAKHASTPRPGRLSLTADVWRRRIAIGIVWAYAAVLVLAPLTALVLGALSEGVRATLVALTQPDLLAAFGRTIYIALITVAVHVVCGTAVAWVIVRHRFPAAGYSMPCLICPSRSRPSSWGICCC